MNASERTTHTPTPWPEVEYDNHGNGSFSEWWEIPGVGEFNCEADAKLARLAVNSHDDLLAAAEAALARLQQISNPTHAGILLRDQLRTAIAAARGDQA